MKVVAARRIAYIILAAALFVVAALQVQNDSRTLHDPTALTGYYLLGLMIFLALFNLRKKLPGVFIRLRVAAPCNERVDRGEFSLNSARVGLLRHRVRNGAEDQKRKGPSPCKREIPREDADDRSDGASE